MQMMPATTENCFFPPNQIFYLNKILWQELYFFLNKFSDTSIQMRFCFLKTSSVPETELSWTESRNFQNNKYKILLLNHSFNNYLSIIYYLGVTMHNVREILMDRSEITFPSRNRLYLLFSVLLTKKS